MTAVFEFPFVQLMVNLFLLVCSYTLLFSKTSGKQEVTFVTISFIEESFVLFTLPGTVPALGKPHHDCIQTPKEECPHWDNDPPHLRLITFCFVRCMTPVCPTTIFRDHHLTGQFLWLHLSLSFSFLLKIHSSSSIFLWASSHKRTRWKKSYKRGSILNTSSHLLSDFGTCGKRALQSITVVTFQIWMSSLLFTPQAQIRRQLWPLMWENAVCSFKYVEQS